MLKEPARSLVGALPQLSERSDKPWVIFFDEANGWVGETMVSFLTTMAVVIFDAKMDADAKRSMGSDIRERPTTQ